MVIQNRKRSFPHLGSKLLTASVALALSAPFSAMAQSAGGGTTEGQPDSVVPAAAQSDTGTTAGQSSQLATVVVTGTHILRNGYQEPTPVTVTSARELEATTPSDIPDALNKLPVFANSQGASDNANNSEVAGNYLNLRNFGVNRTLILMDGLRVPPTNFSGGVDVDTIPQMLLQRVEVVTGGVSAVYGSDAVTGVVNFIMNTHFNGLKLDAETGISGHGDADSDRFGIAFGSDLLGGKGHFEASVEHHQMNGLLFPDRSFSADRPVYAGDGDPTSLPYTIVTNTGQAGAAWGGLATTGPFAAEQFLSNGQLAPFTPGTLAPGSTSVTVGGDNAYDNDETLTAPLNETQSFARFDYDFTDDIGAFIQASDAWSRSVEQMSNYGGNVTFFSGNPYLPPNAQAQLTSGESFNAYIFPRDLDLMSNEEPRTNAYSIVAGLKGDLDGYTWNLSYTHGESRFENFLTDNINLENYFAAADVVAGPNGPECYVSTTQYASLYPGCAPLDLFGEGNESKAALAYIQQNTEWWVDNGMNDVVANITGSPINDWAGPVSLAFDTEYRSQSLNETTDSPPLAKPSFTGLRDLPIPNPSTVYAFGTTGASRGSDSVWEMGGETVVPLVRDLPLVKSLDLSGAARYTDYSTSGEATTWKVGVEYKPVEQLTIRATESRDIRAPTLYDLYAGQGSTVDFLFDPVTFIGKVVHPITEGNPNLVPEVAKTTTAGIVYAPSWLEGLQMSADFYSIILKNAITSLSGADINILSECAQDPNTALCNQLIVRGNGPNSFPTAVYETSYNVARNWTRGVDVDASYSAPLYQWFSRLRGDLNLRLLYSYQPVNDIVNQPGAAVENIADIYGSSYQRATIMVGYSLGSIGLNWQTRWRSAEARDYAGVAYAVGPIPAYAVSDVNLEYRFTKNAHELSAFLNVQNVFNIQPTVAPSGPQIPGFWNPAAVGEDVVGRYFTLGVKFEY